VWRPNVFPPLGGAKKDKPQVLNFLYLRLFRVWPRMAQPTVKNAFVTGFETSLSAVGDGIMII
jgi:hypothetical protein